MEALYFLLSLVHQGLARKTLVVYGLVIIHLCDFIYA